MKIVRTFVDQGPVMKRVEQRAMGRANMIRKRSCHITLVLSEAE
jgi:large subunit ribosomal protein L22